MIQIGLTKDAYEYEIRGLLMAFYPGNPIQAVKDVEEFGWRQKAEKWMEECEMQDICLGFFYPEGQQVARIVLWEKGKACKEVTFSFLSPRDKETKTNLKNALYTVLSEQTGKTLPWGTLTGIRPTKIPMGMLEEGKSDEEILYHMEKELLCRPGEIPIKSGYCKEREKDFRAD